MRRAYRRFASFGPPARLLMINQFGINLGFYMLMPYLADHLAHGLGLAAWTVGLVLGVRNLSQQGMFVVGGVLADRFGCKPMIVAGCALRTAAFAMLGAVETVPALVVASAATGLAGALFNPAVRAHLAADAGEDRRVEAFAVFNVFYQAGILMGPLAGMALLVWDFRVVCAVASLIFGVLAVVQWRALPAGPPRVAGTRTPAPGGGRSLRADLGTVLSNRPFVLFSSAMACSYVLAFQVYLALPLRAREIFGERAGAVTGAIFAVSGLAALSGQLRLTTWARRELSPTGAITRGLLLMAAAFVPLILPVPAGPAGKAWGAVTLTACAALLAWGGALLYPFEMDTVVRLSREGLVATSYGAYSTAAGIAVWAGNFGVGAMIDAGSTWLHWSVLSATGCACAWAVAGLGRSGLLAPDEPAPAPAHG